MDSKTTHLFASDELDEIYISSVLKEVYASLKERGYNPINQIVGYLITDDPGYISSYNDARTKIKQIDRDKIIEVLLRNYMENNK